MCVCGGGNADGGAVQVCVYEGVAMLKVGHPVLLPSRNDTGLIPPALNPTCHPPPCPKPYMPPSPLP